MDKALNKDQRVFEKIWNKIALEVVVLPDLVRADPVSSIQQQVLKLVNQELDEYGLVFATLDPQGGRIVVFTDRYALDGNGNIVIHAPVGGRELLLHAPPIEACVTTSFTASQGKALCRLYQIDIEEKLWKRSNRSHATTCVVSPQPTGYAGKLGRLYPAA